jgi:folate-dependent phosphoribosylglycinamide formyltransferase PurN
MRVAGFMSGSGTNLVKILERQADLGRSSQGCPFEVAVVFTDNPSGNAARIADSFRLPLVVEDILAFYRARGRETKRDLALRPEFDRRVLDALLPHAVDAIALAGYMSVVTEPLLEAFAGRIINVHPADLRILEGGRRKYTGDFAVRDAILSGEPVLRATTHIVRKDVDGGEILMVSAPVRVELPPGVAPGRPAWPAERALWNRIAAEHQERLKRAGDWVILPETIERLARGRYSLDETGCVYLDGEPLRNPEAP